MGMLSADSSDARVVTLPHAPYKIHDVNAAWMALCGYTSEEARGNNLSTLIQGEGTDTGELQRLTRDIERGLPTMAVLTNYDKLKRPFSNFLRVYPLYSGASEIAFFLGILERIN